VTCSASSATSPEPALSAEPARTPAPFIVGAGRSGTTLLRLMLDAHPDVAIPSETNFLPSVARRCARSEDPWAAFAANVTSRTRWPDFHVNADALRERVAHIRPFDLGDALRAFYALYAERFGKSRWGDKTPRYAGHLTAVARVLPEAHFLHVIRDGRDVALSHRDLWFGPRSAGEAAHWWKATIEATRTQALEVGFYREVRYEDLVLDTERTLRAVCEFIDLAWDGAMLGYHRRAAERVGELTADVPAPNGSGVVSAQRRREIFAMTARPPDPSRIGRWRTEMSAAEVRQFDAAAGEMLESLGYERW
jgi:hypothetical protein